MKENRIVLWLMMIPVVALSLQAIELGLVGGRIGDPSEYYYGLSGGLGLILPMLKLEAEWVEATDSGITGLSLGIKIRPKIGAFGPFAVVGGGAEMESLNFDFGDYEWFFFIGAGTHFYFKKFLSIRGDFRYLKFSGRDFFRYGLGVFFHI